MKIENLFPTGILKHKVSSELSDHIESILTPRLDNLNAVGNVLSDYYENSIVTLGELGLLVREIFNCQKHYSEVTQYNEATEISSYWIQDYKGGHDHARHNHGRNQYSAVYWVRANEKSGQFIIHSPNPFSTIWSENIESEGHRENLYSQDHTYITPEKGLIVLFPSYLDHEVLVGREGCVRTTIAFNLK